MGYKPLTDKNDCMKNNRREMKNFIYRRITNVNCAKRCKMHIGNCNILLNVYKMPKKNKKLLANLFKL